MRDESSSNPSYQDDIWAEFEDLVSSFDRDSLIKTVAAIYYWNGEAPNFTRPHLAIQLIVEAHQGTSSTSPGLPAVARVIKLARLVDFANLLERRLSARAQRELPEAAEWERQTLRFWSSIVTNPGTTGQMLTYLLDKFEGKEALVNETLGFTPEQACRTILSVYAGIQQAMKPFLGDESPFVRRRLGPEKHASTLLTPPTDFMRRWRSVSTFTPDFFATPRTDDIYPAVIEFLSTGAPNFATREPSFTRWAFLRTADGESALLVPGMLVETLLSSIPAGLSENLVEPARGDLGRHLGHHFEDVVASRLSRNWHGIEIRSRLRHDRVPGDTDLLLAFPDGDLILVQCKARSLRPAGRWGGILTFQRDLENNFQRGVSQISGSLSEITDRNRVLAVMIVTEAYFPGLVYKGSQQTSRLQFPSDFPNPIALSLYDLDYLTQKVLPTEFASYLQWRKDVLTSGSVLLLDEFDIIRAFLKSRRSGFIGHTPRSRPTQFVGYDGKFETQTIKELVRRLEPDADTAREG